MQQHPKPGYLFFTPRAPNGKRLNQQNFQRHMRASEDGKPIDQEAMDQLKTRADIQGGMDRNNVPRSLQGQISPERAGEVTALSRQPLPAPQIPASASRALPQESKQQPSSQPSTLGSPGAGVLLPASPQGQMLSPSEAAKSVDQKPKELPFQKYFDGAPLPGGWKLGPDNESFRKGGAGLMLTPPWWRKVPK